MAPEKKRKKLYRKLKSKYRIVLLNDETLEEKASFVLSPLNVLILASVTSLVLVSFGIFIIAFTPLREYIPGYMDVSLSKKLVKTVHRLDSLEKALVLKDRFIENINKIVIGGKSSSQEVEKSNMESTTDKPVSQDQHLRDLALSAIIFFLPVKGYISQPFNPAANHYAIDIATKKDEPVKAVLEGTVVMTAWTAETGYVINIQHANNLISVYKHNSAIIKKEGERVMAGDLIAIAGEAGELSTGPHLHLELWYNGIPVNPELYISF